MTEWVAQRAAEHGRLAIDTEFMSERRYRALLCLVQVAVADPDADGGVRTEVLDPLEGGFDPKPLAQALADPDVEVLVHAGRQDVALLRRDWRTEVRNLFDTQVAGGFLGYGPQESYESLVRRVLGERLKGEESFTRWDRRPLTEKQIEYARADASRLLALGGALQDKLADRGRLDWAREECRPLESSSDIRDPERLYERLPRLHRLSAEGRAAARELVRWRERTAAELNRPAGSLMPDQALVELARRMPGSRQELDDIRGLPQATVQRRNAGLLDAIAAGRKAPPPAAPEQSARRDPRDAPLVALAQAVVRQRSLESGVAVELIATQSDLAELTAAHRAGEKAATRVAEGWRADLVGAELTALLDGRRALTVTDGALELHEG